MVLSSHTCLHLPTTPWLSLEGVPTLGQLTVEFLLVFTGACF